MGILSPIRLPLKGLFAAALLTAAAFGRATAWQAGIAKISVRGDLNRQPATGFVIAIENGKAYLVTSAHVVEGDASPQIEFVAAPRTSLPSIVRNLETGDKHGLALLEIANIPAGVHALQPAARPSIGQKVTTAGYPAKLGGSFTVIDTAVASIRGRELVLSFDTGDGFSGAPVLMENGAVAGLVFGRDAPYGLAVQTSDIRTYIEGQGLSWSAQPLSPTATEGSRAIVPASPKAGDVRTNPVDDLKYVFIPPGSFLMGCSPGDSGCYDDEKPPHTEQIANGFWLGQTEVTQAAWKKINRGVDPSAFKGDQLPVESVDWNQAVAYCRAVGGRLPGEKEWEYAARAGATGAQYGPLDEIAWYSANSVSTTHPVAVKRANARNLYDMLGNIWEWTADNAGKNLKILRGGAWANSPGEVRASERIDHPATRKDNDFGFRCVWEVR